MVKVGVGSGKAVCVDVGEGTGAEVATPAPPHAKVSKIISETGKKTENE
jgi:hypothetical protein